LWRGENMDLPDLETQSLLIGGAILLVSQLGFGAIWNLYKSRGKQLRLAKRGLFWVIQHLADRGYSADDAARLTLEQITKEIGTEEFKFPER